jgi:transposase-like protein
MMGAKKRATLTERQRYWLEHIQACKESGKTVSEYAAEHDFDARAMYAGKKVLVKKGMLPRSRPVRFQRARAEGASIGSEWRIQLPNGLSVAFSGTVDARALNTVLAVAAAVD